MSSALDQLRAIFPDRDVRDLSSTLNAARGSVERATHVLLGETRVISSATSSADRRPTKKSRTSLDGWLGKSSLAQEKALSSRQAAPEGARARSSFATSPPKPQVDAFKALKQAPDSPTKKNVSPLLMTTSDMIREHTRDTLVVFKDFFPRELAARLFLSMLEEEKTWDRNRWWLATREVESPHTTQFYCERKRSSSSHVSGYEKAAQHWYNGEIRTTRFFTNELDEARELVAQKVRQVLAERPKHKLEWPGEWKPNVAASNCYRGAQEGVHYHSDVLTHLGPRACIASVSLGVERVFRLRASMPSDDAPTRTLAVSLPHNSLAIMLPGCQELFKHSIPPIGSGAMDVFKLPSSLSETLGVSGKTWNERINVTFRFYRPDFAPLPDPPVPPQHPTYVGTPLCRCGKPCVLRPDARGKSRARLVEQGVLETSDQYDPALDMLYYWQCSAGAQNEGKGCSKWSPMDFKAEGRGQYFISQVPESLL